MLHTGRPFYALIGLTVALFFWFFDSAVHFFVYGEAEFEWLPTEFNELWMRTTIVTLIVALGIFAQRSTAKLLHIEHEKLALQEKLTVALQIQLEQQQKQAELTKETVLQMHDIINNFLNNLLLFKIEAEESNSISPESLELFDNLIQKAAENVRKLGEEAMVKSNTEA
jgi:hypothetical protein